MEGFGDDFGDLYADVEVQATSAINCLSEFHNRSYTEEEEEDDDDDDDEHNNGSAMKEKFGSASNINSSLIISSDTTLKAEAREENFCGSDSEDDLNILLNDDDSKNSNYLVKSRESMKDDKDSEDGDYDDDDEDGNVVGKESKRVRTHGSSFPCNMKTNMFSSISVVKSGWDYNVCGLLKGSNTGHCSYAYPNSMLIQSGYGSYGFSLPWYRYRYRSILDVNSDAFVEKPWRYPGVDLTDFFNFGFDEDSWKQYCNSLEQFQRYSFMQSGVSISESLKHFQVLEEAGTSDKLGQVTGDEMPQVESGNLASSSRFLDYGEINVELSKGRAIQVEDGISERQPSVDIRRPRDRDSDVVIQITVQEFNEEESDSLKKPGHARSSTPQASKSGNVDADDDRDAPQPISCKGDEPSVESLGGNVGLKRCSQKETASNPMTSYPDNNGNNQSPDGDVHRLKKMSYSSEGTVGLSDTVKNTKDSATKTTDADPCIVETELSLSDEVEVSPTSSCFVSDIEISEDSIFSNREKVSSPIRSSMNPGTESRESISSYHENSKGNRAKRKSAEIKDCSRYKFPIQENQKHHTGRHKTPLQPKKKAICDDDASPVIDGEQLYDRDHLLVNHSRRKEKLKDFELSKEMLAYHDDSKLSSYYDGRRYAASHIHDDSRSYHFSKGKRNFHEERDPYVRKHSMERGYFGEDVKRERYHCGKRNFSMDRSPQAYKESRRLVSRISSNTYEEMDFHFKRQTERLHSRKLCDHDDQFLDSGRDDFHQSRYVRSVPLTDPESAILYERYERNLPQIRRELKDSRWGGYDDRPSLELYSSWSGEREDEYYRNSNNRYLSHQSDREFYRTDRVSWNDSISHRLDDFDSSLTEGYQRHGRQLFSRKDRPISWFDSCGNGDEIEDVTFYPNKHDNLGGRRRNWQPDFRQWAENDLTMRDQDDKTSPEKSSFFCNGSVRHGMNHATYELPHDAMHIDDMHINQQVIKKMRSGSNTLYTNRSSKMYKSKQKHTVLRRQNSIDLIVDEGKSSRGCPEARNFRYNGWSENMDPEIAEEKQMSLVDFNESRRDKAIQHELRKDGRHFNNEKWHDKFPVTLQNEDLDIEEGQIVTEKTYTSDILERSCESESQAFDHNVKKRQLHDKESAFSEGKVDQRIIEMLAKMEKRRERFKEPIARKKEEDGEEKLLKVEALIASTVESNQHRPARKRRWGGG